MPLTELCRHSFLFLSVKRGGSETSVKVHINVAQGGREEVEEKLSHGGGLPER